MSINIKGKPAPAQSVAQPEPEPPEPSGTSELGQVVAKIQKEMGLKSIVLGSQIPNPERLATGVFEFDLATGGGFPCSRYSIVYGPESSGKTNLMYKAIAQAQRLPGKCNRAVFVDLEGTFDPLFAVKFGVDVDELIVARPSYGEQAVDMIDSLIRADDLKFLCVDSIAVLVASKEVDASTEKADVGTAPMLVKRLANKLAIALSEEQKRGHCPAVVLLNQTRFKIGILFGDPETMPGGQTIKFNSSLTVRIAGKDVMVKEISSDIPAFKETTATIRKAKIGIVQKSFSYKMCMFEHDGLMVGETDSFSAVKGYLQASGHLKKVPGGWELFGKLYPTQSVIEDTYRAEDSFAMSLQQQVIKNHNLQLVPAAPEDDDGH